MFTPGSDVGMTPSPQTSGTGEREYQPIYVGDRVLVNNKKVGVVRYKGMTEFLKGATLYGIELDEPKGKHNGTVGTRTYFRCRAGFGIFAKRPKLKLLAAAPKQHPTNRPQRHTARRHQAPSKPAPRMVPFSAAVMSTNRTDGQ
jgi:hypothetical protein